MAPLRQWGRASRWAARTPDPALGQVGWTVRVADGPARACRAADENSSTRPHTSRRGAQLTANRPCAMLGARAPPGAGQSARGERIMRDTSTRRAGQYQNDRDAGVTALQAQVDALQAQVAALLAERVLGRD